MDRPVLGWWAIKVDEVDHLRTWIRKFSRCFTSIAGLNVHGAPRRACASVGSCQDNGNQTPQVIHSLFIVMTNSTQHILSEERDLTDH
jgi:hypothetical protein